MIGEDMFDAGAFRLSRIYAQGWNAGRQRSLKTKQSDAMANPYETEPERARWEQGFNAASDS